MSIKTNQLQQFASVQGTDTILADGAAGTGRVPFSMAAQFFDQELVKPESAVGAALENKAAADFSNLPNPQTALYNLGARTERNLLDNPDFAIWQRYPNGEFTGVPNGMYIADRFIITNSNGEMESKLVRVDGGGIKNLSGPPCVIMQRLENAAQYNGKMLTRSFLYELNGAQRLVSYTSIAADWTDTTDVLRVGENQAWIMEGETLRAVKLELGPVQTLARQNAEGTWELIDPPPNPALELAKCQRYLQVLLYGGYDEAYSGIGGISGTDNKPRIQVPFQLKQPMRTNPTLITGCMQVNRARIVERSLSTYLPDRGTSVKAMTLYISTKNQIIVMCELPDTVTLAENYTYELDALSCPRGEVLLASAEL